MDVRQWERSHIAPRSIPCKGWQTDHSCFLPPLYDQDRAERGVTDKETPLPVANLKIYPYFFRESKQINMKQIVPTRVAEIVFALVIGFFGVNHFMHADMMSGYVPDFMPADAKIWVYVTGAAFILAAIAIITGIMKKPASYLLALLVLIIAFGIQMRGMMKAGDEGTKALYMTMLLKDLAMAMGAILIGNNTSR
jgi:putative oxidoreductase